MKFQSKINSIAAFAGLSVAILATAPAQAAIITAWTFENLPVANNNNPAASTGTGTASALGMTNNYTYLTSPVVTGSVNTDDILLNAATTPSSTGVDNVWRVRGSSPGNGWNLAAPQYSQGVEFDTSTIGFKNISLSFDWGSTNQGVKNLQVQYNTNIANTAGWTNIGSGYIASVTNFVTGNIDFSAVAGANNDANFGVRLVSVYDPALGNYGSASGGVYNNNSGNWRFDNIVFSGTASATTPVPEPFTIVGTLIGGATALRMRKRLKATNKL
jgi:hypothetical protein